MRNLTRRIAHPFQIRVPKNPLLRVAALVTIVGCAVKTPPVQPERARAAPSSTRFAPDTLRTFDGKSYPVDIGELEVPADRSRPSGPRLTLRFIRLRSTSPTPGSPMVFLMGGPGIPGTVMGSVPPYNELFQRLRAFGDVILPDQRGLGRSSPVLECKSPGALPADALASRHTLVTALTERTTQCANEWRAKGYDPAFFSTSASADDLEALRRAIGAPKLRLLAFSYGTRLALATLQRHPASIERAVLASVNGPDNALKLPSVLDRKLRAVFQLAEADTALGAKPGELVTALQQVRQRLRSVPLRFATASENTSSRTIVVGEDGLNALVALNIDSPRLPAMVLALGRGDSAILQQFAEGAYRGLGAATTGLMARATNCSAERSRARLSRIAAESASSLIGDPVDNWFLTDEYCAVIGTFAPAMREFRGPVHSTVPTLFISGTLDSNTPPSNVEGIASGFPNGVHVIVENGQHETLPIPAVQAVILDFFAGKDVSTRRIAIAVPRFLTISAAKAPPASRR